MPPKKGLEAMVEVLRLPISLHREIILWVPIEYLQVPEQDNLRIQDFTTSRKKHLSLPLLVNMAVLADKNHHPIETTEYPTSVDPTTCNEKLQESKLRQGKLISWRGTDCVWRR
jgi:hypothetical protein